MAAVAASSRTPSRSPYSRACSKLPERLLQVAVPPVDHAEVDPLPGGVQPERWPAPFEVRQVAHRQVDRLVVPPEVAERIDVADPGARGVVFEAKRDERLLGLHEAGLATFVLARDAQGVGERPQRARLALAAGLLGQPALGARHAGVRIGLVETLDLARGLSPAFACRLVALLRGGRRRPAVQRSPGSAVGRAGRSCPGSCSEREVE